jgi:hypothetical protein
MVGRQARKMNRRLDGKPLQRDISGKRQDGNEREFPIFTAHPGRNHCSLDLQVVSRDLKKEQPDIITCIDHNGASGTPNSQRTCVLVIRVP